MMMFIPLNVELDLNSCDTRVGKRENMRDEPTRNY